jgi:AcrR family transcriptional regulator
MSRNRTPRKPAPGKPGAKTKKTDRRVRRTRDALGSALVDLMHQKSFEEITVQEVLARARVGRSTFYTHYRDIKDLFVSDADEFFEGMATLLSRRGEAPGRVAPVKEMFAHVAEVRQFHAALMASGMAGDIMELGKNHFARGIEQRIADSPEGRGLPAEERRAISHALAGAMLSMLSWWIQQGMPVTAEKMDEMFHRLAREGVNRTTP